MFQDTTPEAEVKLGRTLAGGDDQRFDATDLDADGIPDYVISHRRKVWVFRGGKDGPQFTETLQVLRVADDVSAMLRRAARRGGLPGPAPPARPGADRRDAPPRTRRVVGRRDHGRRLPEPGSGKFGSSPKWKGDLALRLPAILGLLKDPESLVKRFDQLATKFKRGFLWGDFDGDGREDAAVASAPDAGGDRRLDVWYGLERGGASLAPDQSEIGDVFFGEQRVWDLERILEWLGDYADRPVRAGHARPRAGGAPHAAEGRRRGVRRRAAGNLDGAGAAEIVLTYLDDAGRGMFDVWR